MKSSPAPPLLLRPEGVVECLPHGRVAQGRVLGVHVHVAGVPARAPHRRARPVARGPVGPVGERGIAAELHLDAPCHRAVGVASRPADHRRKAQLGRPLSGGDAAGRKAPRGLAGHMAPRTSQVLRLGGEALARHRHVRVARPAPAAQLLCVEQLAAPAPCFIQAQVERVAHPADRRLRLIEAVLHAHGGRALGHPEGHEHVAALQLRGERPGDHARGRDRIAGAGGRRCGGGGCGREHAQRAAQQHPRECDPAPDTRSLTPRRRPREARRRAPGILRTCRASVATPRSQRRPAACSRRRSRTRPGPRPPAAPACRGCA